MKNSFIRTPIGLCLAVYLGFSVLAGCSTNSVRTALTPTQARQAAHQYLDLANKSIPLQALEYRLHAAIAFIQAGEINESQQILRELRSNTLTMDPYVNKSILNARLALLNKDLSKALELLRSTLRTLSQDPNSYTAASKSSSMGAPHIALLLPSKGPYLEAAKTVRDGFLAAYYQSIQHDASDPSVKIYDTEEGNKVREAYQKALDDQSTIIVGPLTKAEVQTIASMHLDIPVLALNTIPYNSTLPKQLYQFGLMPEDEVIAVADHALSKGARNTVILAIQGDWGKRVADNFKQYWKSKNGKVLDIQFFNPGKDLETKIQSILQVKDKERRQDIDMIFIAAPVEVARQIKPLLNLNYAESLPVYATSAIYQGTPSPNKDQDLNGIRFCDMPWIIQKSSQMQESNKSIDKLMPGSTSQSPRFFALGLDAYRLAIQLSKSEGLPSYGFSGYTGELKQNNDRRIQRGLVCAKFQQGVPVPD